MGVVSRRCALPCSCRRPCFRSVSFLSPFVHIVVGMRWWHEHGRESRVASREARGRGFTDHSTDIVAVAVATEGDTKQWVPQYSNNKKANLTSQSEDRRVRKHTHTRPTSHNPQPHHPPPSYWSPFHRIPKEGFWYSFPGGGHQPRFAECPFGCGLYTV